MLFQCKVNASKKTRVSIQLYIVRNIKGTSFSRDKLEVIYDGFVLWHVYSGVPKLFEPVDTLGHKKGCSWACIYRGLFRGSPPEYPTPSTSSPLPCTTTPKICRFITFTSTPNFVARPSLSYSSGTLAKGRGLLPPPLVAPPCREEASAVPRE